MSKRKFSDDDKNNTCFRFHKLQKLDEEKSQAQKKIYKYEDLQKIGAKIEQFELFSCALKQLALNFEKEYEENPFNILLENDQYNLEEFIGKIHGSQYKLRDSVPNSIRKGDLHAAIRNPWRSYP